MFIYTTKINMEFLKNTSLEQPNLSPKKFHNTVLVLLLSAALWGCSTPAEKIQKQQEEVARLEYKLKQQSKNYHNVARQQNIQIDLREEWADPTINQEIWYATDRANDYDKEIEKTKKKLAKAQEKLAKLREEYNVVASPSNSNCSKLNPNKYDYIPEEFNRASK